MVIRVAVVTRGEGAQEHEHARRRGKASDDAMVHAATLGLFLRPVKETGVTVRGRPYRSHRAGERNAPGAKMSTIERKLWMA